MRITANLKFCFGFLLFLGLGIAGLTFFFEHYDAIVQFVLSPFFNSESIRWIKSLLPYFPFFFILFLIAIPAIPFFVKIIRNFFLMRADRIFGFFPDKSHLGVHVFTSHYDPSGGESTLPGTFTVLHYFMRFRDGKVFSNETMAYDAELAHGRSGYEDFDSFEKDILHHKRLQKTLEALAKKTGIDLALEDVPKKSEYTKHFLKEPFKLTSSLVNSDKKILFFNYTQEKSYVLTLVENRQICWQYHGNAKLVARKDDCFILDDQLVIFNKFENSWDEGVEVFLIDLVKGKLRWKTKL